MLYILFGCNTISIPAGVLQKGCVCYHEADILLTTSAFNIVFRVREENEKYKNKQQTKFIQNTYSNIHGL